MNKRQMYLALVGGVLCFASGYGLASGDLGQLPSAFAISTQTDLEWAVSKGYFNASPNANQRITQAEFLKMLITEYDAKEKGVIVPHGAENHWAAEYYATAKKEGLIDCSCKIKPDQPLTTEEASRFVTAGINRKANTALVKVDEIASWLPKKKEEAITYGDAAAIVRKYSQYLKDHDLQD
ncbi:hypothetical protein [Brevibacillus fulvus]|uniref:S-layer homology domain-containing protein n=1 Tax=Brevibacillus fulvus TaxID=1125967 RepID=A0A938Y1D7_9BACL|nr:hypothetical protein [Brevibacillus fulvus]MBM7590226.1 hypothetical protein [Brevibacillus fulvus]